MVRAVLKAKIVHPPQALRLVGLHLAVGSNFTFGFCITTSLPQNDASLFGEFQQLFYGLLEITILHPPQAF